jgi:hypothetical protein
MRAGRACAVFGVLVGAMMWALPVCAQDLEDSQLWVQALATVTLSPEWRAHLELQPRMLNDASELGLTIVRTAVGRQVAPGVTVWLGHAWVPRSLGPSTQHEHRVWQQLLVNAPTAAGWTPTIRLRVEQRWLTPWDGSSQRVRLLARVQRPVGEGGRWSVFTYDEAMATLDATPGGPVRGYDRNRLSAGLVRRFTPWVWTDVGYIWENATVSGGRRNDHVAIAVLNFAWSL